MTDQTKRITEEEFDATYTLVPNHLNPNASWAFRDGPGCLFETYGDELAFVSSRAPSTVWTLLDGDDGNLYLTSGFHLVNRIGYLITTTPVPDNMLIECCIKMSSDDD